MKFLLFITVFLFSQGSWCLNKGKLQAILDSLVVEIDRVDRNYAQALAKVYKIEKDIYKKLASTVSPEEKVDLLIKKENLETEVRSLKNTRYLDISKIRYLKGIQVIRLLYGKILALDHHFAAVTSLQDINAIANPNNYPKFVSLKDDLSKSLDKKQGFSLGNVLGNNIYASVAHSIVSVFNASGSSKGEKQEMIRDIECILDFTLRVHNDLNTIYFETAYLQKQNKNIKSDILQLFEDFTSPIEYNKSLEEFRLNDDWDTLKEKMDTYLKNLQEVLDDKTQIEKARRMRVNIEFPTDRLLQFLTQYNAFINEGTNFYEKFQIMLASYEQENQCATKIPNDYKRLQAGVSTTIKKFNTAYKPVEINGSKLKEILYGLNEYD